MPWAEPLGVERGRLRGEPTGSKYGDRAVAANRAAIDEDRGESGPSAASASPVALGSAD